MKFSIQSISGFLKLACCITVFLATFSVAGPVSHFGYLQTCKDGSNKGQICGSLTNGSAVMVKGPSLFWSSGNGNSFYKREIVDWFVDKMEIGVVRAAMAIKYNEKNAKPISKSDGSTCEACYGYLSTQVSGATNYKAASKALVQTIIDAAVANDIYVIVDWHSHNATSETNEAANFFKEMANANPDVPNIIWEIYNEPVSDGASNIKSYANTVISAIRSTGNKNLIIVGSDDYSKKPGEQSNSSNRPTDSENNTAYSFHFYAASHPYSGDIGTSANAARDAGYAVFATEWGSVNYDGAGSPNSSASQTWYNWMDGANISGAYWNASNISDGGQTSNIFNTAASSISFSSAPASVLTSSGQIFQTYMGTKKWTSYIPTGNPSGKDVHSSIKEGESKSWTATDLGISSGATLKSAVLLGDDPGQISVEGAGTAGAKITYTSAPWGSLSQAYINYTVSNGTKDIKQRIVVDITDLKVILPKLEAVEVSRRAPTYRRLSSFNASINPNEMNRGTLSFTAASADGGASAEVLGVNKDSIKFTPPASIRDAESATFELSYSIKSSSYTAVSTQTITLNARNFIPTVPNLTGADWNLYDSKANTEVFKLPANKLGKDLDDDPLIILGYYLPPEYPGTMVLNSTKDTLTYTPEPGKKGTVRFLVVVTDGFGESNVGGYRLSITGSSSDATITADAKPTEIPNYTVPVLKSAYSGGVATMQSLGNGRFIANFAQSGNATISVFSISGKFMGNLLQDFKEAGAHEFSLDALNLQKGIYIVALKQGQNVKTLKVIR